MERESVIDPATSSLGSWHSTAELLPLCRYLETKELSLVGLWLCNKYATKSICCEFPAQPWVAAYPFLSLIASLQGELWTPCQGTISSPETALPRFLRLHPSS